VTEFPYLKILEKIRGERVTRVITFTADRGKGGKKIAKARKKKSGRG